jgi:hypothetical protein
MDVISLSEIGCFEPGNLFYKKQFPKEEDSAVLLDLSTEAEKS